MTDQVKSRSTPPRLHHVNLKTFRVEAMVDWYEKAADMRVLHRAREGVWMTNDGANHRLALLTAPDLRDDTDRSGHCGMHHMAFEFGSFEDLMARYHALAQQGIEPAFCLDHGMTISMYYRDPDGNHVELQSDVFGDWGQSTRYVMDSPVFEANPIGEFFDAARLFEAYRAGSSLQQIHEACMSGRFRPAKIPDIGVKAVVTAQTRGLNPLVTP
jgi:catechol-2,3-dioxygenase